MTTRAQWQAMTEQQQWDYLRLLEDTVDALELDGDGAEPDVHEQFTEAQVRKMLKPYMYERSIKDAPRGHINGARMIDIETLPTDATSPHYRRQFLADDLSHS